MWKQTQASNGEVVPFSGATGTAPVCLTDHSLCRQMCSLGWPWLFLPFSPRSFFLAYFRLSILPAESNIFAPVSSTTSLRVFFFRTDFTCNQNSCPCCIFFVFLFFKSEIWFPFQTCSDGSSASYHSHPFLITFLFVLSGGKKKIPGKKIYLIFHWLCGIKYLSNFGRTIS